MSAPSAVVTGISGQDGSYLARDLLSDGYRVFGVVSDSHSGASWRHSKLRIADHENLELLKLDISNPVQVTDFLAQVRPDEIYNLASHSFVADSQNFPQKTTMVSGYAVVNLLEAINQVSRTTKFFQAGSSEMFGAAESSPQNEKSKFSPRNIYGSAKVFAHNVTENYRQNSNLFASAGILYNHESPLRGEEFVTRKITRQVAKIKLNKQSELRIGNLSSLRDWGFAPEYAQAMRLVLGHDSPDTFVIASGVATSVRDFVKFAFSAVDIEVAFEGSGLAEVGVDQKTGKQVISVDSDFYRPSETVTLVGDPEKAERILGWTAKTKISEIVGIMVQEDLDSIVTDESKS
jgi:GDPmannose 4,6-dehydratase